MLLGLVGLVSVLLFSNGLPPVLPCIYAGIQFFISFFMRIPACHSLINQCYRWSLVRFVKWMCQERYYVGRGMFERTTDFIKYMFFWLVILSGKFAFAYFLQIKPLVEPTRIIVNTNAITYTWHDLVSGNNYNALTVAALWAPVVVVPADATSGHEARREFIGEGDAKATAHFDSTFDDVTGHHEAPACFRFMSYCYVLECERT